MSASPELKPQTLPRCRVLAPQTEIESAASEATETSDLALQQTISEAEPSKLIYIRTDVIKKENSEISLATQAKATGVAKQLAKLFRHHEGPGVVKTSRPRQRPAGHWFG